MNEPKNLRCSECGHELPGGLPAGLCPRCALSGTLELPNEELGTLSSFPAAPEAGERIGRYKLLEKIGEGGCGVVYMAEQEEPVRRRVALKVIKPGMDTREVIARFEAERQALALMDHPHIAKIFDGGTTETGRPYFVMELVRGLRITDYCDQKNLSTRQRLDLFMQVCQAVQHAHQKGVIHRDLKPSNILVTVNDGVPVPKVIDFGIAKATGQRLTDKTLFTKFQQLLGTPAYMSPEQAEMTSVDIDTRSDIYSLGVLLYELLTGRTPFDTKELLRAGMEAMLRTIREQEPVRPSARLSTLAAMEQTTVAQQRQTDAPRLINLVRGDLDWIVMKCLEKDRARRYETATGLAMDLQRHLDQEPVVARPPTTTYRVQKFVRRNKGLVAATSTIALVLVLGVLVSTLQWQEAENARVGEAEQRRQAEARAESEARAKEDANLLRAFAVKAAEQAKENTEAAVKANAEALREREVAEAARNQAKQEARRRLDTLTEMQIRRAEDYFVADDSPRALLYLAAVLEENPSNRIAADRLLSALTFRNLCLPVCEPLQHGGPVDSADFSRDGKWIVTASKDNTARIWDAQVGRLLTEPLTHQGPVSSAQFSADGQWIVTASKDRTACVWSAQTGRILYEPYSHERSVQCAQFSPDGKRIVTASWHKGRVWDVEKGNPLTDWFNHKMPIFSAQFSPDGRRIVTASQDDTVQIWDAETGIQVAESFRHGRPVFSAQFSPDGRWIVSASADKTAQVWDVQTGQPVHHPLKHEASVSSAQFSPDGWRILTTCADNTARVWDVRTGKLLTESFRHEGSVSRAQFSPDGRSVVTFTTETCRMWDAQTGKLLTEPLRHGGSVSSARFSPNGQRVVTASEDSNARVWDVRPGFPLAEPQRHGALVYSAQFSLDGRRIVTASKDTTARVWDSQTGLPLTEPLKHEGPVRSAEFSPNGETVVTASGQEWRVWDIRSRRTLTGPFSHTGTVLSAHYSPDGQLIVTASMDGTSRVWDSQTGKPVTEPLQHKQPVYSAQFSPNSRWIVTASQDRTARVWDVQTGAPITEPLTHEEWVGSARFNPDGQQVVTASGDKTARIWDVRSSTTVTEPLKHEGVVRYVEFSANGEYILTASEDKTAQVWDARTGRKLNEPLRHDGAVWWAEFSADGQRMVTASADGTSRVWDVRTGSPLSEPLQHGGFVGSAHFSPDGQQLVSFAGRVATLWEIMDAPAPAPRWLPELARTVAGTRLDGTNIPESAPERKFLKLKSRLLNSSDTDYFTRWAKWFLGDRSTRLVSPFSIITVPEYIQRRVEENSVESLLQAIQLSSTNGLAFARLARLTLLQTDADNPRRMGEAEFFSRRAVELSPKETEVQRIRTEIVQQIKNSPQP